MPSVRFGGLPFREQIDYYRSKVPVDTDSWTDVYAEEHDVAAMVSGARGQVLTDLVGAIDGFISQGKTLDQFRQDFDAVVAKTGWAYNGGRNWRTRVIYETNLRQSYHAGREVQMADPAVRKARPYGLYRHGGSEDPREEHLSWDGLVLPLSDPWWATHSPQNGWGCNCKKYTVSERDVKRMGLTVAKQAPAVELEEREIGVRGPNPQTITVPKGIDPGFEHRPGDNRIGKSTEHHITSLAKQNPRIAAALVQQRALSPKALAGLEQYHREWLDALKARGHANNAIEHVGTINQVILQQLESKGLSPQTIGITLRDRDALHILRDEKAKAHTQDGRRKAISEEELALLPRILATPQAVLWDARKQNLVYVFPVPDGAGKIIVELDYSLRANRQKIITNNVVSGGVVRVEDLKSGQYELWDGDLN